MSELACLRMVHGRRLAKCFAAFVLVLLLSVIMPAQRAEAACNIPNQIVNGQVADAAVVMGNFNGLKDCVDAAVMPSGSPITGSLPVFAGPKSIQTGDLSGDCTTSGGLAVTCTKTNGTAFGPFATGTDAGHLTGNLSVSRFNNGTNADNTTFLRGDGVWAVPPGTGTGTSGGGSTDGTPAIRASTIAAFNASSVTIAWPPGTVAGDLVIIFVSDGYAVNSPAAWTIFNNTGGNDWANGLTAAKMMTPDDITAGSATITLIGAYNGVAAAVTVDGTTFTHVREVAALRSAGSASYPSAAVTGLYTAASTDLILGFTYIRGAMNPSISNFSQLQMINAANASGYLSKYTAAPGKLGIAETATYPSGNNGYYWSVVALH